LGMANHWVGPSQWTVGPWVSDRHRELEHPAAMRLRVVPPRFEYRAVRTYGASAWLTRTRHVIAPSQPQSAPPLLACDSAARPRQIVMRPSCGAPSGEVGRLATRRMDSFTVGMSNSMIHVWANHFLEPVSSKRGDCAKDRGLRATAHAKERINEDGPLFGKVVSGWDSQYRPGWL